MYPLNEFVHDLKELLDIIDKVKVCINKELSNEDSNYVYDNTLIINDVDFKGRTFCEIEHFIKYFIDNSKYADSMKLNDLLRNIKLNFMDRMILDVVTSKHPKSFELYKIYNEFMDKMYFICENGYQISDSCFLITSLDDIDKLEEKIKLIYLNVLNQLKNTINKKDSSWFKRKKVSNDYVKRNKK